MLLLVARRDAEGVVSAVLERATITRIGRGVDRTGRLSEQGIDATLETLRTYAGLAREAGAERIAAVGTSALRDADNGASFLEPAAEILGSRVEVITGRREAELTFRGALQGLALPEAGSIAVLDIGGGSTEIVRGRPGGRVDDAVSLDIGSVRLFERCIEHDPPEAGELTAVRDAVDDALRRSPVQPTAPLVGIAGTVTTLAAIAHAVEPYDPTRIHGVRLSRAQVDGLVERLASASTAERKRLPGLEPERADVIVVGALLVERALARAAAAEIVVSHGGVRVGLADELLD